MELTIKYPTSLNSENLPKDMWYFIKGISSGNVYTAQKIYDKNIKEDIFIVMNNNNEGDVAICLKKEFNEWFTILSPVNKITIE